MLEPTNTNTAQGNFGASAVAVLLAIAVTGGVVYAMTPKAPTPPTAQEIMATLPREEAEARAEYANLVKGGHDKAAKAFAKEESLAIAMTAVEVMHDEAPATDEAPAPAEETAGNVQSPPLS